MFQLMLVAKMEGSELLGSSSCDFTLSDFYDEDMTENDPSQLTYGDRNVQYQISCT